MHAQVISGVDILELDIPFSDPMAKGQVIQRASERALKFHINIQDVLKYVKKFRKINDVTPIILIGYANSFEHFGIDMFITTAKKVGVDGIIVVDYPPEECKFFIKK